jgi:hypothetical protein
VSSKKRIDIYNAKLRFQILSTDSTENEKSRRVPAFSRFERSLLLDLIHHCFESIWMIHSQISQDLSVELNALLRAFAHEFTI